MKFGIENKYSNTNPRKGYKLLLRKMVSEC